MADKWISEGKAKGTIREGGLHKSLGIAEGKRIPAGRIAKAAKSRNPKVRKQARLAQTFARMRSKR